jgi:dienelactone hydrolase
MGRSNGGTAAIMISQTFEVDSHAYSFAGTFAISPGCAGLNKADFSIPVVIFIGTKDDANDPKVCEAIRQDTKAPVKMIEYKGVYHGFEDNTPTYTHHGWHMEHNPEADKDAMKEIIALINSKSFPRGIEVKDLSPTGPRH